jgi:peptidoglycan/LPS O-acetylase OafA/YrhL/cellulose synthase/poly-beta-1,6-N-acetylglucosamine synthase-like glycosyltransferase
MAIHRWKAVVSTPAVTLRGRRARTDVILPAPPSNEEKFWYMGRQHRWLLIVQACSFLLIAYSIFRFATADTRLILFLLPMSLYAITLFISLLSSTRGKRTSTIDHEQRVLSWRPDHAPSVDVFLPSAGEPLDVLENTFKHVAAMKWNGVRSVHVLDDSARPEVRTLAEKYWFNYHVRPNRGYLKKAGNLRYGYENSTGDFILILDADFAPRPDALIELIPYFDDPDTGIVQSPQFFDTRHRGMGWLQRCAGATQELFYRWIQPARDASNAAICVGTCAVYRRAALARSGGFAQIGHSEDVHTGVNMMKVGFLVRYVPVIIAKGLCPDTVAGFLNQQYRWCTGSMSLLADKGFHTAQHISFRQRLSFWSGFLYYISTGLNAFIAPLPALAMLYFLPKWIEPMNSIWLIGAIALWFAILPAVMKGHWRVEVLRVQVLYSFAHAVAIFDALMGRTQEWVATGAANTRRTPLAAKIGWVARIYVGASYTLLWVGLAMGTARYGFDQFWAMIALACIASYIHLPILFISTTPQATIEAPYEPVPPTEPLRRAATDGSRVPASRGHADASDDTLRIPPQPEHTERRGPVTAEIPQVTPPRDLVPEAPGPRRFRPDIQGLRAIAVTLVVLYHAHVPGITGGYVGVDVFFVISGFLITGQLMREVQRTGRVSFTHFYVNRIRRLLPPAAVVVILTVIVARTFGSLFQFKSIAMDALYTTFYLFNYRLAAKGVDYQNATGPESPLQHFWSLAVEEQFYFVWPLLLMACVWIFGRRSLSRAKLAIAITLAGVVAVSLYYSITVTVSNAPLAYFSLHTRAWELGAGALVSLGAARLSKQPRAVAIAASWAGVALIVGTGLYFTDDTAFPGSAAIWPTLGTALVIAAGCRKVNGSAELLLDRKPMQGIGAVSYSWYLWHWPILILAPFVFGHSFEWVDNVQLMVLALWLAVLSYWVIESPTRRTQLRQRLWTGVGATLSLTTAATAAILIMTLPPLVGQGAAAVAVSLDKDGLAAVTKAIGEATLTTKAPSNLTPSLDTASKDQPVTSKNGCHLDYTKVDPPACIYGDRTSKATHTAVLLGDSHAQQWLPALDKAARDHHWKLIAWTKAACPLADVTVYNSILKRSFTECNTWRAKILDRVALMGPDRVIISQSNTVPGTGVTNNDWAEKTAESINTLQKAHIPVVYVGDTPYHTTKVPECVARNLSDVGSCTVKRQYASPYKGRAELLQQTLTAANVTYLDPTNWFCTKKDCPAIVGNLLVYRDESHISTAYSYYLAPLFAAFFPTKK